MIERIIDVAWYLGINMAFTGMLWRFEIPVTIVPGQQHVFTRFPVSSLVCQLHGLQTIFHGR